jgi:hypothetical protein
MRFLSRLLLILALGSAFPGGAWAKGPAVVELFTAQGCASCKQANRLIARMADRPGVIALTWSVDYWDYLGWKDTFARPEFTLRQKAYARHVGPADVYTPQVIVNGAAQASGDDAAAVESLIKSSELPRGGRPTITPLRHGRVRVGPGRTGGVRADVWLVRYDPKEQDVEVTAGDNRGARIAHRNVVREIVRLGQWRGQAVTFADPPGEDDLAALVIVQRPRGGAIIAAARLAGR